MIVLMELACTGTVISELGCIREARLLYTANRISSPADERNSDPFPPSLDGVDHITIIKCEP